VKLPPFIGPKFGYNRKGVFLMKLAYASSTLL